MSKEFVFFWKVVWFYTHHHFTLHIRNRSSRKSKQLEIWQHLKCVRLKCPVMSHLLILNKCSPYSTNLSGYIAIVTWYEMWISTTSVPTTSVYPRLEFSANNQKPKYTLVVEAFFEIFFFWKFIFFEIVFEDFYFCRCLYGKFKFIFS
jgi:hypothetical protein